MSHTRPGRSLSAAAIATAVSLLPMACTSHAPSTGHSATPRPTATVPPAGQTAVPQVRVNQVGYPTGGTKVAYAMLPQRVSAVSFTVAGRQGVVFRGRSGRDLGSWNSHYPAVYQLGFSSVARPGSYRITVHAAGTTAVSPAFTIGSPPASTSGW
jgi:endoglucanase